MVDGNLIKTLAENAILPTFLFVIFLIYHRGEQKKWLAINQQQVSNNDKMFQLLQNFLTELKDQSSVLQRMDTKLTMSWSCPLLRRDPSELQTMVKGEHPHG